MFDEWRGDQNVKVSLKEKLIKTFKNLNAKYDTAGFQNNNLQDILTIPRFVFEYTYN